MENNKNNNNWTELPNGSGPFWRRVTLKDGTIYHTSIQYVMTIWGKAYLSNDKRWPDFNQEIKKTDSVTWSGPLIPPPNH